MRERMVRVFVGEMPSLHTRNKPFKVITWQEQRHTPKSKLKENKSHVQCVGVILRFIIAARPHIVKEKLRLDVGLVILNGEPKNVSAKDNYEKTPKRFFFFGGGGLYSTGSIGLNFSIVSLSKSTYAQR